jgi:hypothetical protein
MSFIISDLICYYKSGCWIKSIKCVWLVNGLYLEVEMEFVGSRSQLILPQNSTKLLDSKSCLNIVLLRSKLLPNEYKYNSFYTKTNKILKMPGLLNIEIS